MAERLKVGKGIVASFVEAGIGVRLPIRRFGYCEYSIELVEWKKDLVSSAYRKCLSSM